MSGIVYSSCASTTIRNSQDMAMDGQWLLDAGIIAFKTRFSLTVSAVNSTTSKRTMVFGFPGRKSSPQPWTPGSYPGYPGQTMLPVVTNLPTYSVASPCYSYAPQLASPMIAQVPVSSLVQSIPVQVPVPVAVQSPVVQMPPSTTTYTVFQPVSSIPSPVIKAPVAIPPENPPPVHASYSPRSRHPQPMGDGANALMLVQNPQQAPYSSPSNITINLVCQTPPTPQQQPMQFQAVAHDQSVSSPFLTVL